MIADERKRQESVRRYGLAGRGAPAEPDRELTELVARARDLLGAESAAVNILDDDTEVRVAAAGAPLEVNPRTRSVCHRVAAAFPGRRSFMTSDPQKTPLVADHPWVNGDLDAISFYAGVPLVGIEGRPLGVLCAWSFGQVPAEPRIEDLETVGRAVMAVLDARRRVSEIPHSQPVHVEAELDGDTGLAAAVPVGRVIDERLVQVLFQPVVEIATGAVVGFEALARGPAGTHLESPRALLDAARDAGRLGELDWVCRAHAMEAASASGLPPGLTWFINVERAGVETSCPDELLPVLNQARSDLRVVLDIVERDLHGHLRHLLHTADQARRDVWGVALDHVGSGRSSLALLPILVPDVVKFDMSLVQAVPDPRVGAVSASVRAYAERTGAVVVATGIETEVHERRARALGAAYGQGHHYGRPGPLPSQLPTPPHVIPLRQQLAPLDGGTPFEVASRHTVPEQGSKQDLLPLSRYLEDRCGRLDEPFVLLAGFQRAQFLSAAARGRYRQLSLSSAMTVVIAEGAETEQTPTFRVGGLLPGSRMRDQWVVAVLSAGFSAAFVGQDRGDRGSDRDRRFDFVYTHDPQLVAEIGRSFVQALDPTDPAPRLPEAVRAGPPPPVPDKASPAERLRRYVRRT